MYFFHFLLILLPTLAAAKGTADAQNATVFSLLYGYPLLAWQKDFSAAVGTVGSNTWVHARGLANASSDGTVVKPNVDTLYSQLIYDLSQADVLVTLPDLPNSYFKLFSFYDPYGDNFVDIGTGTFYQSGKYLIRPYDRPGGNATVGLTIENSTDYVATVNSPTIYGVLLIRWGVKSVNLNSNEVFFDDINQVHKWQDECQATTLTIPKDVDLNPLPSLQSILSVYNASAAPAANFAVAGVYTNNHTYTPPTTVNLTSANTTAVPLITAAALNPANSVSLNHGWHVSSPSEIGIYNTNYALRAAIAASGYLALRNPFAIYPSYTNISSPPSLQAIAGVNISSDQALLVTFSGIPPLKEAGFWSLTIYNESGFLIPNSLNVYALGDRSNVTYPDGTLVALKTNTSEGATTPFQILVQPADVKPPGNWTWNWIPAPAGGGVVEPTLRFYGAEAPLTDGSYVYPKLEVVAAVRRNGSESGGSAGGRSPGPGSTGGAANLAGDSPLLLTVAALLWLLCTCT